MTRPYPLAWPESIPRHKGAREAGQFRSTLSASLANAKKSIIAFGRDSGLPIKETDIVFSSNVGGLEPKVTDPGVALWFQWDGEQRCIAVDRYSKVEANLQAIHHIIEADRVKLRHGSLAIVRAAYKGFTAALPKPGSKRPWREVLGFEGGWTGTESDIQVRFRELAARNHPDRGGNADFMAAINAARDEALKELSS